MIRYHVWWPSSGDPYYQYNTSENRARNNYYNNNYTPHFFIDGNIDGQANRYSWAGMIEQQSTNPSTCTMEMFGTYNAETLSGEITVRIIAEEDPGLSSLRLRIALTESRIYWHAPNGTDWHHQTFRDMIPNTTGEMLSMQQGDTLEFTYGFETPSPLVPENCELVAFVQSDQNRHILQGCRVTIPELEPTGIEDDLEMPEDFVLAQNYPNPFNASTKIGFRTSGGHVRLEVFDLTGSLVKTLVDGNLEAGAHSVVWDGLNLEDQAVSSGIYFYRLTDSDGQQVKRMTLLK